MNYKLLLLPALITMLATAAIARIDAELSIARFQSKNGPYVEIHTIFYGSTLTENRIDSTTVEGAVEALYIFKKGEQIVHFDKLKINSPKGVVIPKFVDLQRYGLAAGDYLLEVTYTDVYNSENTAETKIAFTIAPATTETHAMSDVVLLNNAYRDTLNSPLAKHGVFMEPLPSHFYNKHAEHLYFYTEIYGNESIDSQLLIRYYLEPDSNNLTIGQISEYPMQVVHKKKKTSPLIPLILPMDLKAVPSGVYNLVVEIRNLKRELYTKRKIRFERSNPFFLPEKDEFVEQGVDDQFVKNMGRDSLSYALHALVPRLVDVEVELINQMLRRRDSSALEAQRLYLLSYWSKFNPNNPEKPYSEYMEVANAIHNKYYSGFGYGFETDRGYIYLKYGQPNDVLQIYNEVGAPPYEIWAYNDFPATNQANVKFLFYNPSLATNDFKLLHSTAIGEVNNSRWEVELYRNAANEIDSSDPTGNTMMSNFNRQARQYFDDL